MRSWASLILASVVLTSGGVAAYGLRKPAQGLDTVSASPHLTKTVATSDFRAHSPAGSLFGPVPAAPVYVPVPRLLGRIETDAPEPRPLGLAQELPPLLPEQFFTDNAAFDSGPLDVIEP